VHYKMILFPSGCSLDPIDVRAVSHFSLSITANNFVAGCRFVEEFELFFSSEIEDGRQEHFVVERTD
jgi:hypothetical protein